MSLVGPAPRPCGSCPYRLDVPPGIWTAGEYAKLPRYDAPTGEQPPAPFACHQQDGRMCAGWCATHDTHNLLALRLWAIGRGEAEVLAVLDYVTVVPVFASGADAAVHGLSGVATPPPRAERMINTLLRKQGLRNP